MSAPGNSALIVVMLAAFVACCAYAAGRLHQRYQTARDREEAYRHGYDTATRSVFSMAARIIAPRRAARGSASVRPVVDGSVVAEQPAPPPSGSRRRRSGSSGPAPSDPVRLGAADPAPSGTPGSGAPVPASPASAAGDSPAEGVSDPSLPGYPAPLGSPTAFGSPAADSMAPGDAVSGSMSTGASAPGQARRSLAGSSGASRAPDGSSLGFPAPPPPPPRVVPEPAAVGGLIYRPFPDPRPIDGSDPLLGDPGAMPAPRRHRSAPPNPRTSEEPNSEEAAPVPDAASTGRHTVPDELVQAATYRLPADRIFRAKVPDPTNAPALPDEATTRIAVPKPRQS